jgi:hypothetical protein
MAIGPFQELEVGKNENLDGVPALLVYNDNPSSNTILWSSKDTIMLSMIASKGQGRMNNAIIADISTLMVMKNNPDYRNKWIYLSGESGPNLFMGHGMLYWFTYGVFGEAAAQHDAEEHPDGTYLQLISTG